MRVNKILHRMPDRIPDRIPNRVSNFFVNFSMHDLSQNYCLVDYDCPVCKISPSIIVADVLGNLQEFFLW